jgi:thioredoxin reductase
VVKVSDGFIIHMAAGESFHSKKIILAGGIQDIFPDIEGLSECWGITVLHCPYCHGYEVKDKKTGLLANGENAFEFTALISNWTKDLMLYTNGKSQLKSEQRDSLERKGILISEKKILKIDHESGKIKKLILEDNSEMPLEALYVKNSFRQASSLHEELGCRLTEEGHLSTDSFQRTSVPGVYACGDNSNLIRTLANAIASGTTAGMMVNKEMVLEEF